MTAYFALQSLPTRDLLAATVRKTFTMAAEIGEGHHHRFLRGEE